jgi:hypothetical protein
MNKEVRNLNSKRMKIKLVVAILALILFQINLNAQDNQNAEGKTFWNSLWGSVEVGYGRSFEDGYRGVNMYLASLRAKIGYYLTPQFSLGVGIGLNGYHTYTVNTLPVVLDIKYHPIKTIPKLYAYADIGASVSDSYEDGFTSGFLSDIGLGYKIYLGKRTSLNPAVGYNLFISRPQTYYYDSHWQRRTRHTIFLRLGFQF